MKKSKTCFCSSTTSSASPKQVLRYPRFWVGFLPQYLELRSVRAELTTVRQANSLAEIRDLAGYLMLETSQKNYGIASGYATRFFERARQVHEQSSDPEIRQTLEDVLAARDIAVTIVDIDQAALDRVVASRGERFRGQHLDVRDRDGWARTKVEAEAAFGPVDILVNNAGIGPDGAEIADLTFESFDRIIDETRLVAVAYD